MRWGGGRGDILSRRSHAEDDWNEELLDAYRDIDILATYYPVSLSRGRLARVKLCDEL